MSASLTLTPALRRLVVGACCVVALSAALPSQVPAAQAGPTPSEDGPPSGRLSEDARVIPALPARDPLDLPHVIVEGAAPTPERASAHWVSGAGLSVFSQTLSEGAKNLQGPRPLTPIQWSIVASGGKYVAERLATAPLTRAPAADAPGTDSATWFVNLDSGEVTPGHALMTGEAEPALTRLLSTALARAHTQDDPDSESAGQGGAPRASSSQSAHPPTPRPTPKPAPPYDDLFFAPDGALIVTVPSMDRASFTTIRIGREASASLLSPEGVRIRDAITSGGRFPGFHPYPHAQAPLAGDAARFIGMVATEDTDCSQARCVALTFDDGPHPQLTPQLLDLLFRERVHVTFFVQGDAAVEQPNLVMRALREGHTIGTHTWSHPRLPFISAEEVHQEVTRTKDVVIGATGRTPILMRPPYGEFSSTVLEVLRSTGDAVIMWNVDTEDWKNKSVPETTRRAVEGSRPGSIILMHDVHPTSVQSVPGIIRGLQDRGFSLVSVPTLLGSVTAGDVYYGRE